MKRETWAGAISLVALAVALVMLYHNRPDNPAPAPQPKADRPPAEPYSFDGPPDKGGADLPLEIPAPSEPSRPPPGPILNASRRASRLSACPFAIELTFVRDPDGRAMVFMPLEDLETQIRAWRAC